MAIANSLFLSHAGSDNLPLAFIAIGLFSMPAYALFSQIVDRYSRPQLFRYALLVAIAMAIGMWFLVSLDTRLVYYILLVAVFFQWDFHNNILYPSLLTDYFTTLEYKRYAPYIGMAQAAGTLIGGVLTAFLCRFFTTQNLLLCMPVIFGVAFLQLLYLESSQRQIETIKTDTQVGMIESLKTFPNLVKRYPLMLFLACSSFLLVIIYITSEFLWLSIYAQNFTDEALTGFLGLMRVLVSVVQVAVLYCFTRPLLHWLGVSRMNVVYPLTTLVGLLGLAFNVNIKSAVGLHINGDALYKSINLPVHQLNYNAVPREFLGRIRTLSDGFFYSIGLTLAGIILWFCHTSFSLTQITWGAVGLTLVLLILRLPMGQHYAQGLEEMIRSAAINLDELRDVQAELPPQSTSAIRDLLKNEDRYTQIKGLELAVAFNQPSQFLDDIQPLLTQPDPNLRKAIVKLLSTHPDPAVISTLESLLDNDDSTLLGATIEIFIANQYNFEPQYLHQLLTDQPEDIQGLAVVAANQTGLADQPPFQEWCQQFWQSQLQEDTVRTIVRAVSCSGNRALVPLLQNILQQDSTELRWEALEAMTPFAQKGDRDVAELAVAELSHPEPLVREAALQLLALTKLSDLLPKIHQLLGDPDPRVRQRVATVLAAYGEQGLSLAQKSLSSPQPEVVNTAIAAIGQVRTKRAGNILFEYLTPDFQQVVQTRRWQQQIPTTVPSWQPLAMVIEDYHHRLIQKVLYVLSCLGHARTVNAVNRILNSTDQRDLANAVEVLASLRNRRFVLPLIPILEQLAKPETANGRSVVLPQWMRNKGYKLLLEALDSTDRWIRIGALIVIARVPSALVNDSDPLVKSVAEQILLPIDHDALPRPTFMKRLLLLKNVALFKNLSLDELMLIDKNLVQAHVLAGETIFAEGSWCNYFYLIESGSVRKVKSIDGEQREINRLSVGEYFGEVALFDDAPHWDGAIAYEDCTLLKLEKNRFISLMTQRPHIILEICRFMSQRLRETDHYRSAKHLESPQPSQLSEV